MRWEFPLIYSLCSLLVCLLSDSALTKRSNLLLLSSHFYSLKWNSLKYSSKSCALLISRRFNRNYTAQLWYLVKCSYFGLSDCQTKHGHSPVRSQATLWWRYNCIHPYFRAKHSSDIQLLQQSMKTTSSTRRGAQSTVLPWFSLGHLQLMESAPGILCRKQDQCLNALVWPPYTNHVSYCYDKPSPFLHGGLFQF